MKENKATAAEHKSIARVEKPCDTKGTVPPPKNQGSVVRNEITLMFKKLDEDFNALFPVVKVNRKKEKGERNTTMTENDVVKKCSREDLSI